MFVLIQVIRGSILTVEIPLMPIMESSVMFQQTCKNSDVSVMEGLFLCAIH